MNKQPNTINNIAAIEIVSRQYLSQLKIFPRNKPVNPNLDRHYLFAAGVCFYPLAAAWRVYIYMLLLLQFANNPQKQRVQRQVRRKATETNMKGAYVIRGERICHKIMHSCHVTGLTARQSVIKASCYTWIYGNGCTSKKFTAKFQLKTNHHLIVAGGQTYFLQFVFPLWRDYLSFTHMTHQRRTTMKLMIITHHKFGRQDVNRPGAYEIFRFHQSTKWVIPPHFLASCILSL